MKKLFMMIVGLMCMLHAPYNLYVTNLSGTNPYSKSFEDRDALAQHVMELLQNRLPQTLSYDEKK